MGLVTCWWGQSLCECSLIGKVTKVFVCGAYYLRIQVRFLALALLRKDYVMKKRKFLKETLYTVKSKKAIRRRVKNHRAVKKTLAEADRLLRQENAGITDEWYEED